MFICFARVKISIRFVPYVPAIFIEIKKKSKQGHEFNPQGQCQGILSLVQEDVP